jgi:hypothetical protein
MWLVLRGQGGVEVFADYALEDCCYEAAVGDCADGPGWKLLDGDLVVWLCGCEYPGGRMPRMCASLAASHL